MTDHYSTPAEAAPVKSGRLCDRPIAMPAIGAVVGGVLSTAMMALAPQNLTGLAFEKLLFILTGVLVGAGFGTALRVTRLRRPVASPWRMVSWGFVCGTGATLLLGLVVFLVAWNSGASFGEHSREPYSLDAAENASEFAELAVIFGGLFLFPIGFAVGAIIGVIQNARRPMVEVRRNCERRQNEVLATMTNESPLE